MDWITSAQQLVALLTGLVGLISAGIGVFFAIKNWNEKNKEKSNAEKWAMLMKMTDAAMKEAEKSKQTGADKKTMVINIVKESCNSAGLDIGEFIDQLNAYIDNSISWFNGMNTKK